MPPYLEPDIVEPVTVQLLVTSSNKFSEPHNFVYTPKNAFGPGALAMATTLASLQHAHSKSIQGILRVFIFIVTNTFFLIKKKEKKREKNSYTRPPNDAESQRKVRTV